MNLSAIDQDILQFLLLSFFYSEAESIISSVYCFANKVFDICYFLSMSNKYFIGFHLFGLEFLHLNS